MFLKGPFDVDDDLFFKHFQESTFEGSWAAERKMKNIAKRQTEPDQKRMLFDSLYRLAHHDNKKLQWPNSPLLVLLEFVDPSMLSGDEEEDGPLQEGDRWETPLHHLAALADPFDYSTHENQLILAKQLIEHGANVNALLIPDGTTPLHRACDGHAVTNLDFVELLLVEGADPNAQSHCGKTPLMCAIPDAPGSAKFLLNWPTTDANITSRSGASFLDVVRFTITKMSDNIAGPDDPDRVQDQFLLQQWREIEEMLVERGAHETGTTAIEYEYEEYEYDSGEY
jgi:hypothetical protein